MIPRDVVQLGAEVAAIDEYGTPTRRPGPAVSIAGRVQPVRNSEQGPPGAQVGTDFTFRAPRIPAGAWSTVSWRGRTFDVVGEPARHNGSDLTAHDVILMRARQPEVI